MINMTKEEVNLAFYTIYASRNDTEDINGLIQEVFQEGFKITASQKEVEIQPKSWFSKNKIIIKWDSEDTNPEYFKNNIPGMMGFYQNHIPFEDDDLQYRVMMQISVFNTIVAIETEKDYNDAYMQRFVELQGKMDGIGFISDGTLIDRDGRVIVYPSGKSGPAEFSPRACTRKIRGEDKTTPEGKQRKEQSIAYLKDKQVPVLDTLPELPPLEEMGIRSLEEIARRAVALLIVIQYACDINQDNDLEQSKTFVLEMLDKYGVADVLTESEQELLDEEEPEHQAAVNLAWQYEAYWALLWILGLLDTLDFPDGICDCDFAINTVSNCSSFAEFVDKTSMRSAEEILDEADKIYRMHWACVNHRIQGKEAPAGISESVVMERRRGLFWALGYRNEEWDHISMDT
ncbi:protein of unknown function [Fontibacillus panacisegetis]|uniref:DUF4272 domain-containing protein n=1 Tax=Fontibacillus panacisegetis TaxID=670482 RepID=A0A1G7VK55_9BACL|nr:protein of unknown function [Fontibacillus panacisegetis]